MCTSIRHRFRLVQVHGALPERIAAIWITFPTAPTIHLGAPISDRSAKVARRETFDLMRCAYDVRSKVVHGDRPTSVRLGGKVLSLQELAARLEETTRLALRKMIRTAVEKAGASSLVDWDALILNGGRPLEGHHRGTAHPAL
jgi:hypothetical protein